MIGNIFNKCLQSLVVMLCFILPMGVAAAGVAAVAAHHTAMQFLNSRQGGVLSAQPQQLTLVHAEKSKADARLADYYVFNAGDGSAFVIQRICDRRW